MQRQYTSKLFFKKYPYKIQLARSRDVIQNGQAAADPAYNVGWNVYNASVFLQTHGIKHRMYNKVTYSKKNPFIATINSSLFVSTKEDFDTCIGLWQQYVQSVTSPFNDDHVDMLKNNTEIVLKPHLLYKKFRYVVSFKRGYNEDLDELDTWVNESFDTSAHTTSTARWTRWGWYPRLYLINKNDLLITKLTYSDRIHRILVVRLFDEPEHYSNIP